MNIIKKIGELDTKVAEWHGVKFDGKTSDMLLYVLPRTVVVGGLVFLLVACLVIA